MLRDNKLVQFEITIENIIQLFLFLISLPIEKGICDL